MKCKDQDFRNLAALDESRNGFIRQTRVMIEQHSTYTTCRLTREKWLTENSTQEPSWIQMRQTNDYGNDLYYISQLYQENWEPQATI